MDPLLWWIILVCLIVLIVVLSLYFVYRVLFSDNSTGKGAISISATPLTNSKLNKYRFRKTDVEDLTSIEAKYPTASRRKISLIDQVDSGRFTAQLVTPNPGRRGSVPGNKRLNDKRRPSLLTDIHESGADFGSAYSLENLLTEMELDKVDGRDSGSFDSFTSRKFSVVTEGMRRSSLGSIPRKYSLMPESDRNQQSNETINSQNTSKSETMQKIGDIEDQAFKVDYEIGYFIGTTRNLKFFEINDKLIRLSLALTSLNCDEEESRNKKREVQRYINKCKEKLNKKVEL